MIDRKVMSGMDIILMRNPIVYLLYRGEQLLYIGSSDVGFCRLLDPQHHILKDWLESTDRIEYEQYGTRAEVLAREKELIFQLAPSLNITHNYNRGIRKYTPRGMWTPDNKLKKEAKQRAYLERIHPNFVWPWMKPKADA